MGVTKTLTMTGKSFTKPVKTTSIQTRPLLQSKHVLFSYRRVRKSGTTIFFLIKNEKNSILKTFFGPTKPDTIMQNKNKNNILKLNPEMRGASVSKCIHIVFKFSSYYIWIANEFFEKLTRSKKFRKWADEIPKKAFFFFFFNNCHN